MDRPQLTLSPQAAEILRRMVTLRREGHRSGPAFDLDANEAATYDRHPTVVALRELETLGLVSLTEDEVMRACYTLAADLTDRGVALAEEPEFAAGLASGPRLEPNQ